MFKTKIIKFILLITELLYYYVYWEIKSMLLSQV